MDLHIIRSHYFNAVLEGNAEANTLFNSEKAQQDLIDMWYQLSEVLRSYSTDYVAYEFMNEPVAEEHEQWNELIAKVHRALREAEPQRTLVIGSNMWQGYETFKYLRVPEGDPNIVLSFHYYNPMILTHRGAWWTPIGKYAGAIAYPGVMVSEADYEAAPEEIRSPGGALYPGGMEQGPDQGPDEGCDRLRREIRSAALLRRMGRLRTRGPGVGLCLDPRHDIRFQGVRYRLGYMVLRRRFRVLGSGRPRL